MNMIVPASDLGDAQRHHAAAGSHRHRRPCRSRQVDAGRPPAARDRQPARGQARNAESRQRAARHAVRMVVPARCAADRARPGHHHRHHADPLPHRLARRRADRRARPRRIPAQHDHRRLAGRRRGADHRRAGRRARPDPAARLSAASARRQTGRRRRQQDGPGRFQRGALQGDQRRDFRASDRPRRHAGGGRFRFPRATATASPRAPPTIGWYNGPTVVEALDALEPARPLEQLALRLPVQAIYKFDDRRIVAGRIESGSLGAGDEIVIMPAGKIAKIRTVEGWPVTPVTGTPERRPLGRHHARPRTVHRTRRRHRPCRRQPARHAADSRADFLAARQAAGDGRLRSWSGSARGRARATVVAIEKAVDPGELSSVGDQVDRAQSCRRDRHLAGAADRGRSLCRQSAHRTAGDRGQRPHRRRRPRAVGRCRPTRGARRYRAGGIRAAPRRALGALSPQRRGGLADGAARLRENRRWRARWSAGCSAMAARRSCSTATRCAPASMAISAFPRKTAPKTSAGWPKSRPIWRATAISPSSPRSRRRRKTAPPRAASPTPRSARSMSRRRPRSARAATPRAITPRRAPARCTAFTGIGNDYQPPAASELTIDTSARSVADATDEIERMLAEVRHSVRRTGRSGCQYLSASGHIWHTAHHGLRKAFSSARLWR